MVSGLLVSGSARPRIAILARLTVRDSAPAMTPG